MHRIFGPVPSRRLGRSLGIDVVPYKTCTFDCIYCECGETTHKTCTREEFYAVGDILEELEHSLSEMPEQPDVLTVSGAGEPTLFLGLGDLIDGIRGMSEIPVAVITNSSLLWKEDVREELSRADIVLPSLDAATEEAFHRINRPHERCRLEAIIEGLGLFGNSFEGTVLLEILLVDPFNTHERELEALRDTIAGLNVDSIQLNTAVRPGTHQDVAPLDRKSLEAIRRFFGPSCEIIADATRRPAREERGLEDRIVSLLKRRPCTADDIHLALGTPVENVVKLLALLSGEEKVVSQRRGSKIFYTAAHRDSP